MMKTTTGQRIYMGVALLTLLLYGMAEARGWATGGTKRKPLPQSELRQSDLGYRSHRTHVFWFYGFRGK